MRGARGRIRVCHSQVRPAGRRGIFAPGGCHEGEPKGGCALYRGMIAETVVIRGHNGDEIETYYARPVGAGPFPGVVVIHHMPGWDEWTHEVVRKFAHHGYAAIGPHLYSRLGPGSADDLAARARAEGGVADEQVVGDVAGAMAYLRAQPYAN